MRTNVDVYVALLLLASVCNLNFAANTEVSDDTVEETNTDTSTNCAQVESTAFHACFDDLKETMLTEAPSDVAEFLCSSEHKSRLNCIITHFRTCPALMEDAAVEGFKHTTSGFHAKELYRVSSADDFCACFPTFECLQEVDFDRLGVDVTEDKAAWSKLANPAYICNETNKGEIKCVADKLPMCTEYLTYKQNVTKQEDFDVDDFDSSAIEHAAIFADKHCESYPEDPKAHECSAKRSKWNAVTSCKDDAAYYVDKTKRECGMRICIEKAMFTCPPGDMGYYIDSVNVFSEIKVETEPCTNSSPSSFLDTLTVISVACVLSFFV